MENNQIIRKFWVLILLAGLSIYDFFLSHNWSSLLSAAIIFTFLFYLKLVKNETHFRFSVAIFLLFLASWRLLNWINKGQIEIYMVISTISVIFLIYIYLSKNGLAKVRELSSNDRNINIIFFIISTSICYMMIQQKPNDLLENLTVLVSGTFSVITGWFLFSDLNQDE
jgi:hypothetical protein